MPVRWRHHALLRQERQVAPYAAHQCRGKKSLYHSQQSNAARESLCESDATAETVSETAVPQASQCEQLLLPFVQHAQVQQHITRAGGQLQWVAAPGTPRSQLQQFQPIAARHLQGTSRSAVAVSGAESIAPLSHGPLGPDASAGLADTQPQSSHAAQRAAVQGAGAAGNVCRVFILCFAHCTQLNWTGR